MYILCLSSLCSHLQAMCLCACLASPHACFYRLHCDVMPSCVYWRVEASRLSPGRCTPRSAAHFTGEQSAEQCVFASVACTMVCMDVMERAQRGSNAARGDISVVACNHRRPVTGRARRLPFREATGIAISGLGRTAPARSRPGSALQSTSSVSYLSAVLVTFAHECFSFFRAWIRTSVSLTRWLGHALLRYQFQ